MIFGRALLSFAAWVWVGNLLYNLFDVADRYMIVHTSNAPDPLAVVGSYHSSRIVPLLLVSIATLLGTMLLPHLSHDWESGRRERVSATMNLMLKLLGLLLFTGSIAILLAGPFLFNVAFNGKFRGGLEVLPWTLTYCSWFGLATMAQMYLWCAERAHLSCLALFIGLVTNIGLNLLLLPHYGLPGSLGDRIRQLHGPGVNFAIQCVARNENRTVLAHRFALAPGARLGALGSVSSVGDNHRWNRRDESNSLRCRKTAINCSRLPIS